MLLVLEQTVAVIGAGPSGIIAAKRLIDAGFSVTVFERRSAAGGVWLYDSAAPLKSFNSVLCPQQNGESDATSGKKQCPASTDGFPRYSGACYQSLMTNVKTSLMKFHLPDDPEDAVTYSHYGSPCVDSSVQLIEFRQPWFVPHPTVLHYLQRFSEDVNVHALTQYKTNVVSVEEATGGKWNVSTESFGDDKKPNGTGDIGKQNGVGNTHEQNGVSDVLSNPSPSPASCSTAQTHTSRKVFDKVVVCTGHFDAPYVPPIPGLDAWYSSWPDRISHSKEYRTSAPFQNKTVLVVGAGSSAYDIGREIARAATTVYQIVRRSTSGPWSTVVNSIVPANMMPRSEIEAFGDVEHGSRIQDASIKLKDGTSLTTIDHIIFCTGYRFSLPFLPISYHAHTTTTTPISTPQPPQTHPTTTTTTTLITDGRGLHNLHKDMFFIPRPTLAFMGVPFTTFPFLTLQASTIAAVFSGRAALPTVCDMLEEDREQRERYPGMPLYALGVEGELAYVRETQGWWGGADEEEEEGEEGRVDVKAYERRLREAERKFPEALGRWLRETRILEGVAAAGEDDVDVKGQRQSKDTLITQKIHQFRNLVAAAAASSKEAKSRDSANAVTVNQST